MSLLSSTRGLQVGVGIGVVGVVGIVALWQAWHARERSRPAVGGEIFALLALGGLALRHELPGTVVLGVGLLAIAGRAIDGAKLPLPALAAALAPGAVVTSLAADDDVVALLAVVIVIGGVAVSDLDRRWRGPSPGMALLGVSSLAVWAAASDPRPAMLVAGIAILIGGAAWPGELVRVGPGGAAAVAVLASTAVLAMPARPTAPVVALGGLGILVGEPLARAVTRFRGPLVHRPTERIVGAMLVADLGLVVPIAVAASAPLSPLAAVLVVAAVYVAVAVTCAVIARRTRAGRDVTASAGAIGWVVVAGSTAVVAAWWVGIDRPFVVDWLWTATPILFVPVWFVAADALVARRRSLLAASAALVLMHVALVAPPMAGAPEGGTRDVRIVTANIAYYNDDWAPLLREIQSYDPDVIVLQEARTKSHPLLIEMFGDEYPNRLLHEVESGNGQAVFSRLPMRGEVGDLAGRPMITVALELEGGRTLAIWNVHTASPTTAEALDLRGAQLDELRDRVADTTGPLVVAGDFNATRWHRDFRDVLAGRLRDAHMATGRAYVTTWQPAPLVGAQLDHVLVSDEVRVVGISEGSALGSDHRPLVADLRVEP